MNRFTPACAGTGTSKGNVARSTSVHPRVRGDRPCGLAGSRGLPVHPRVRGDRFTQYLDDRGIAGSPPRARGQVTIDKVAILNERFTPACAGTGRSRASTEKDRTVHPRVRGDRDEEPICFEDSFGSPPRARGQEDDGRDPRLPDRFTPACAGTGARKPRDDPPQTVHPRVRGDRSWRASLTTSSLGSPPRARGQGRRFECVDFRHRFTPACAGTGGAFPVLPVHRPVHPRVRGDRRTRARCASPTPGSPPRARGQVRAPHEGDALRRFTPACAGTGPLSCSKMARAAVHPRVRGDRSAKKTKRGASDGSPPRARGQGPLHRRQPVFARFTPACAGTGYVSVARCRQGSVHPRVRGDRRSAQELCIRAVGSPPRARGQGRVWARARLRSRFTPACAGTGASGVSSAAFLRGSPPRARGQGRRERGTPQPPRFTPACAGTGGRRPRGSFPASVHPRVRGDRVRVSEFSETFSGSPPRARGQGTHRRHAGRRPRFTPACAGTGRPFPDAASWRAVHPRVRGDRLEPDENREEPTGSPPRARGQGLGVRLGLRVHRFTPACAGTGAPRLSGPGPASVHPRVRGDRVGRGAGGGPSCGSPPRARGQGTRTRTGTGCVGSPPRARGQGYIAGCSGFRWRFTPACAGTGSCARTPPPRRTVHPRVRGDRVALRHKHADRGGSPPRARGQARRGVGPAQRRRFTPACAGTGHQKQRGCVREAVHPRVRGDRRGTTVRSVHSNGSPPRARGQGRRRSFVRDPARFTPACAGTGPSSGLGGFLPAVHPRVRGDRGRIPHRRSGAAVHPRVRGDRAPNARNRWSFCGSPPRARGQDLASIKRGAEVRFTPACAGTG